MDVNYWYFIDIKWLVFYFLDCYIFMDEKYLFFLKIYFILNERYDFILFGILLMFVNNVYRFKEEKNIMDGFCLLEMSYIIFFNCVDIDGCFCLDLFWINDEVNVVYLISLIIFCLMIIIVYIFMFLYVFFYVVVEYCFLEMIWKFCISYILIIVNIWMFIYVYIFNLLWFFLRILMINCIRFDVRYVVFCYFSSLYYCSVVYYIIVLFFYVFSVFLFNEEKNVLIVFGFFY